MEEVEVMNALKTVAELSSVKIEKLNNESINESAENQESNTTRDPEQVKKSVTFVDKSYQPTFQMQPEIVNYKINVINDQQFVFGTGNAKTNQENKIQVPGAKESLDLLKRSIESLKNREFGNFADNILESVSKLSIEKSQQFKEIKNKISAAEINDKMQNIKFKDIEITLLEIQGLLEEILSSEQYGQAYESEKRYIIVIQKLYDILSILFGQFRDKIEVPDEINLDLSIQSPEIVAPMELDTETPTNEKPVMKINTDEKEADQITVIGKRICKCFSVNKELDKQSDDPVYANDTQIKTAKSVNFEVLEEENEVPLKSYSSLINTKINDHHLRKVQNVDDLSKTESSTLLKSQSFMHFKDIDKLPVDLQTEISIQNNIVQVSSIPSIITRHYHADTLKEVLLSELIHTIKNESMFTAMIEDLNDDGFLDLPKVPSSALSEASSSEWIDENISFVHQYDEEVAIEMEPKLLPEIPRPNPFPIIPEESLCSVLNEPRLSSLEHSNPQPLTLPHVNPKPLNLTHADPQPLTLISSEPQPSTSANSEPVKKQKRFSGCKNFVKRLISNTLLRKKDRN